MCLKGMYILFCMENIILSMNGSKYVYKSQPSENIPNVTAPLQPITSHIFQQQSKL